MTAPAGSAPGATAGSFSRTALVLVIGAIAASLIGAIVLTVFLDDIAGHPSTSADGYSVSAIGHHGLAEVLQQLDIPVVVSRHDSGAKVTRSQSGTGLLVVAEPVVPAGDDKAAARLRALVTSAPRTLVVLPKWYGEPDPDHKRWLDTVSLLEVAEVRAVLAALDDDAAIARGAPAAVDTDTLGLGTPSFHLADQLDLAQVADHGDPIFALGGNALVWQITVGGSAVYILSDPDVLNNAGLTRPGNAHFAVALIDQLRQGGPVVIDETLHGYAEEPSLWRALFRFPLAVVTLHVLLLAGLVLWAGAGRFGPAKVVAPPFGAGKEYLVRNTAALMRVAGHHGHALERYLAAAYDAVKAELHAPAELTPAQLQAWMEHIRLARRGTIAYPALAEEVAAAVRSRNPRQVLIAADRVHRWRTEMTHGPRNHP